MRFLFWLRRRQKAKTYSAYYSWFSILSRHRANLGALILKNHSDLSFRSSYTTRTHSLAIILSWLSFFVYRRCYRTTYVEWSVFDAHRFWLGSWKRKSICAVMTAATTTEDSNNKRERKKLVNCTTAASHQLSNESQNFYILFNFILFLVCFLMFEKTNAFP